MTLRLWILSLFAASCSAAADGPAPDGVVYVEDVEYAKVDGESLRLDIARPKEGGPFPGIVCIHGGGWRAGNKAGYRSLIRELAAGGYVAATVSYRFAPKYVFPAQVHDVKRAVRWLRAHASEYRLDAVRIGATGDSAGGHLSRMLGVTDEKAGVKARLETMEGAGHGWGGDLRRRTAAQSIRFFDEHLEGIRLPAEEGKMPAPAGAGIFYNEDDSNRFGFDPPGEMKPERLDGMVDDLAGSHVRAMLVCCCAKKTNFPSVAWEPHCEGFDPALGDDQPYFGDADPKAIPGLRRWAHNLRLMLDAGVDPTGRMLERCRPRGIEAWVSIRMNDVHDADRLRSPLHSRFWKEHPECWRYPDRFRTWTDRNFNYALAPVRDRALALIREVCERYRPHGLELDWNRFPLHFREGEEADGARILTDWMARVREVVRATETSAGHRIILAARVPARPDVAVGTGLDAVAWAKKGLIDHVIVAPFWTTTDFDIPVDEWIRLLEGTGVAVTAGLESRVQTYPGGPVLPNTAERRRGAAMAALARGSQGIYLFNYFEVPKQMPFLLRELDSIEILATKDRTHTITFTDIQIPGKPIPAALPKEIAPGASAAFSIFIGPKPAPPAECAVHLLLESEASGGPAAIDVAVNGRPARAGSDGVHPFDRDALIDGANRIRVANRGSATFTVTSVELAIRFPGAGFPGAG